ncbi:MAG: AAA family ATPase [Promethearchaeota archaeon]
MSKNSNFFRDQVWYIINTIQANQLFVHSSYLTIKYPKRQVSKKTGRIGKKKLITQNLPEILILTVLNALVPNSAMLLIGGHGGGKTSIVKYLGRMFTGKSLSEIEEGIIRAHPQLTEEKIIATLDMGKLMKGKQEVIWRSFATSFWKIVDEVNRCSPYTQNILLSLLAEGTIKYYDDILNIRKYCLYATLNPKDAGTFEMSMPFLDRFGISVPISMPKSQDLAVILESRDDKLGGFDELVQVPEVLSEEQLLNIWYEVETVPCSSEAKDFIHAIVREYTLCDRIDKGNSDYLKPSSGLCAGCHYNISDKIPCSNCDSILSVRVAKDLLRYSKALSWLLDVQEVSINIILAIAPYVIAHRVNYVERSLNKSPYWGNRYNFTKKILDMIRKRYNTRKDAYNIIKDFRSGQATYDQLEKMRVMAKSDLVVNEDLLPLAELLSSNDYQKKVKEINEAEQQKKVEDIARLRSELLQDMMFPNRGELITRLNKILRVLTLRNYNVSMEIWDNIRFTIDGIYPQFAKKLLETTKQRGTYRLRTEDLELEINITGTNPYDVINFSFFGGEGANRLYELIEKNHRKSFISMEELLENVKKSRDKDDEFQIPELKKKLHEESENNPSPDDLFDDDYDD